MSVGCGTINPMTHQPDAQNLCLHADVNGARERCARQLGPATREEILAYETQRDATTPKHV